MVADNYEPQLGRVPIRFLSPQQPERRWPAKAYVGEVIPFAATVFREGHDVLGAELVLTNPVGKEQRVRMRPGAPGTDRWHAVAQVSSEGEWRWRVHAFTDEWATWLHNAEIKIPAGQDVEIMLELGRRLLERAPKRAIVKNAMSIASTDPDPEKVWQALQDAALAAAIQTRPITAHDTDSETIPLRVERERAGVGSWYEFFPRSEGAVLAADGSVTSGTMRTAVGRLQTLADRGFDVIYIPPVHPIGTTFRKGRNNSVASEAGDPGSPYAIGSPDGGHDAIHPELGTEEDFRFFTESARAVGMEVALDFALNASPDHPWVTEHPEWFTTLPDGTIAYAENPPKKYQDIYPVNFDLDFDGITAEVIRILRYWISLGVTIFRVDNPHTKPLPFWEIVIHAINAERPDIIFLSEAFTRPAMMEALAGLGFQQSYTYFTWRNTKEELGQFFEDISHRTSPWMRPNFFVNTHDILTEYLQFGGVPAYRIRAALAATASPSWGVYAGYELVENVARPGSEENIDNEKYEFKFRDWEAAEASGASIMPFLGRLNEIRRQHPALRQLRNLSVHWSDDDSILVYSKQLAAEFNGGVADTIIVIANLDPHSVRETFVHLDVTALGLPDSFDVIDLITGQHYSWGVDTYVRLDAFHEPVHVLHVVDGPPAPPAAPEDESAADSTPIPDATPPHPAPGRHADGRTATASDQEDAEDRPAGRRDRRRIGGLRARR